MSEKVLCEKSDLVAIADAVREATGSTENYNVSELSVATVEAISSANPILQDKTVSPTALDQIITPDNNYDGLSQVIVKGDADLKAENIIEGVTIFDVAGSNPYEKTVTDTEVNTQADLISQIATALEGKVAGGSEEPTLQSKTVMPSVTTQTVTPDNGYDGLYQVIVDGDSNLVAENIAEGVSIFGVVGTHVGETASGGSGGSDEDDPSDPDPSTPGSVTISLSCVDVVVKTQKNPMATTKYVSKIMSTTLSNSNLFVSTTTSFMYMTYISAVPGSLIFIKTANSPINCNVTGDLELIDFVSASHAIVRVAADGEIDSTAGRLVSFS